MYIIDYLDLIIIKNVEIIVGKKQYTHLFVELLEARERIQALEQQTA